ncbi:MAG: S-layer homology domain-containing protein [Oscillospiraceae bacterium]|nr:S-layer homology domain-containing protein [Bacillota bacterium]
MRKLLSGLLVLVMLVALLPVTALAAQEVGLVEADAVLENGTVVLTLTAAEETTSGRLTVEYDNALLTYAGLKEAGTVTSEDAGEHAVTFAYATSSQDALKAGSVLATLEFTAKTDVSATWLTVTVEDFNAQEGVHLELPRLQVGKLPFTDVAEGDWYYDAVAYVWQEGFFRGMTETTFAPNLAMTRGMFVTVLGRMAGVEEDRDATSKFTDVKSGSYYAGYVAWAAEQDIVRGTSATTFSPNAKVTREQMATMMYRYAKAQGLEVTGGSESVLDGFADSNRISGWAKEAMIWAVSQKLLIGTGAGLEPQAYGTRAQSAQVILNFHQYVDGRLANT